MTQEYDCLIVPVMTEKTMNSGKGGVYVFKVDVNATKLDIKKSVEKVFDVKVAKVNVLNRGGKKRVFRGKTGKTTSRRHAVVCLSAGVINFEGGI
ncbi:MAG: 50S ribosomal protein L23 [Holosporaceae bacterium]|jgi:large subunit ribosomal protein L23|nr:50S ribosomal protein L23 [Holosporaceae bacterium]